MFAHDVLWVEGTVEDRTRDTVREFRNASLDKAVNVERDSSNRDGFVTAWKFYEARTSNKGSHRSYVFVSGLKNLNPRSESRVFS